MNFTKSLLLEISQEATKCMNASTDLTRKKYFAQFSSVAAILSEMVMDDTRTVEDEPVLPVTDIEPDEVTEADMEASDPAEKPEYINTEKLSGFKPSKRRSTNRDA
jgi:hypothetical protein